MRKLFLFAALLASVAAHAQQTIRFIVRDDETQQPLAGATAYIDDLKKGASSDTSGVIVLKNIPNGKYEVKFSMVGYLPLDKTVTLPLTGPDMAIPVSLDPTSGELAEVVVQTNRTNQNRSNIPTRIEALPPDEMNEKGTLSPGNIKMLLGEASGVYVQPTSAVSGTASFRIEGLDSRYTQLLRDGLPMYDGFSGGLSLVQISPLDLKQVEFIKGPASTLYGGGAIAGLINLISKTPESKPELSLLMDATSAKGADMSGFYSQKWKHIGTTIFSSYNYNGAYDPSGQGFSAIPQTNRVSFAPKIFLYPDDKNKIWFGINLLHENRLGGDMQVINGNTDSQHQYFERNLTNELSTQFSFTHQLDSLSQINVKNTIGLFDRTISEPQFLFKGLQTSSYTEANYVRNGKQASWVGGVDVWTDHLQPAAGSANLGYTRNTFGAFAQNTWKLAKWFSVESGMRLDYNTPAPAQPSNGLFALPRVYTLFTINDHWSSRLGGGLGYEMPNLFNDDSEEGGYRYLQPLNTGATKAERSAGGNADVTYKGGIGDAFLQVNEMLFLTRVNNPLELENNAFVSAPGYLVSRGTETNLKLLMDELGLYLGYTYADVQQHFAGITTKQPLTPEGQLNADLTYEVENNFRAGVEGFYTGRQLLSDGTTGRSYWTFGVLVQKSWKHFDIFINGENLTDQRQTRWSQIYTGPMADPTFKDVYTPLEGVTVNVGIKIKLLN